AWGELGGDDDGMAGSKLLGHMARVEWQPPILTFTIERHGRTVLGSTRAEIQQGTVDLDCRTATFEQTGRRQLSPTANRVDVKPIDVEIADLITGGVSDERLRWLGDGRIRVLMGKVFPQGSGFKQTVQGRRRRLRESLIETLSPKGWQHLGRNIFAN